MLMKSSDKDASVFLIYWIFVRFYESNCKLLDWILVLDLLFLRRHHRNSWWLWRRFRQQNGLWVPLNSDMHSSRAFGHASLLRQLNWGEPFLDNLIPDRIDNAPYFSCPDSHTRVSLKHQAHQIMELGQKLWRRWNLKRAIDLSEFFRKGLLEKHKSVHDTSKRPYVNLFGDWKPRE